MMMTFHARDRARERYGIVADDRDAELIADQVSSGRAVKLAGRGRRTAVYLVTVQGVDCVVVFSRRTKAVVTFLPFTGGFGED
jgi:hypothetical protein